MAKPFRRDLIVITVRGQGAIACYGNRAPMLGTFKEKARRHPVTARLRPDCANVPPSGFAMMFLRRARFPGAFSPWLGAMETTMIERDVKPMDHVATLILKGERGFLKRCRR
jgi:hypothetical protein